MNENLLDLFRHDAWASKTLIAACRVLSREQLQLPGSAAYGSILGTFDHFIGSHAVYLRHVGGAAPDRPAEGDADLDDLERFTGEVAQLWERFLSEPFDPERILSLDDGTYECPVGIVIAQAIHHGNAHREQICAMLTGFGIEPPDMQPWGYADATGRGRFVDR